MGKRKGRGGGGPVEDQYGEAFVSQDREERPAFASKSGRSGMTGGGEAGMAVFKSLLASLLGLGLNTHATGRWVQDFRTGLIQQACAQIFARANAPAGPQACWARR